MSTSLLVLGVLFGSVGLGFFVYGTRQKSIVPLVCGFGLMLAPYLITNVVVLVVVGVALVVVPYFIKT